MLIYLKMYNIDTLKEYLTRLNKLDDYDIWRQLESKTDIIKNIKLYYNRYIFISIVDFHEGHYEQLFPDVGALKSYLNSNLDRKRHKQEVKDEQTYRIFLR